MTAASKKAPALTAANIYDAGTADIAAFAMQECGLEFPEGTSREYMISEVCEAMDWAQRDPSDGATHVVLKIGKTMDVGGSHDARVGFNGTMYTIQREKEVEVPIGVYNVLMDVNSVGFTIKPMEKGKPTDGSPEEERIEKTVYPIQVSRFIKKA